MISKIWRKKYESYEEQLDDAPATDSWDSEDHLCRLEDLHARTSWSPHKKGNKVSVFTCMYFRVKRAAGTVSWLKQWLLAKIFVIPNSGSYLITNE